MFKDLKKLTTYGLCDIECGAEVKGVAVLDGKDFQVDARINNFKMGFKFICRS